MSAPRTQKCTSGSRLRKLQTAPLADDRPRGSGLIREPADRAGAAPNSAAFAEGNSVDIVRSSLRWLDGRWPDIVPRHCYRPIKSAMARVGAACVSARLRVGGVSSGVHLHDISPVPPMPAAAEAIRIRNAA